MRTLSLFGLIFLLSGSVLTSGRNLVVSHTAIPQDDHGLEILKASCTSDKSPDGERSRVFTIVLRNAGDRSVKTVGFAFDNREPADVREMEPSHPYRCGFIMTDLDIGPDSEVTITRELSGSHCVPGRKIEQSVRIQEIVYEDGGKWLHLEDDQFGWVLVESPQVRTRDSSGR